MACELQHRPNYDRDSDQVRPAKGREPKDNNDGGTQRDAIFCVTRRGQSGTCCIYLMEVGHFGLGRKLLHMDLRKQPMHEMVLKL